ncbi:MAG: acetyl-CoA carboxylase biotin carboxyl carrier protein [Akkermansiaceae bacterium]
MDLSEIRKIVKLMDDHGLSLFQFEKEDFNLKLKKGSDLEDLQRAMAAAPVAAAPVAPAAPAPAAASADSAPAAPAGETIDSPMVGTFYRKPSPDADLFVNVGDPVSEGQTICIIEAMKVMNEIKAEKSGTISEICVEDGSPVQFGDTLFRLK